MALVLTPAAPLFEVAVPWEVFGVPRPGLIDPPYQVTICVTEPGAAAAAGFIPTAATGLDGLELAETVIVPACADVDEPPPPGLVQALRSAYARGARIVGLCSGAFALAEAGLLDGRRATTHWMYAERLSRRYPSVQVDPAILYTTGEQVYTSAGTAAGIDLCLELVRRDHGSHVANEVARRLVVAPHRAADQAQFVPVPVPENDGAAGLGPALEWARAHLDEHITLADLAGRAHISPRTLIRRFEGEYGVTPSQWLRRERLRRAQELLEMTSMPVDQVAHTSGYGTAASMRQSFARDLHTSPAAYRQGFRHRAVDAAG